MGGVRGFILFIFGYKYKPVPEILTALLVRRRAEKQAKFGRI
jgi:hypothetical protein